MGTQSWDSVLIIYSILATLARMFHVSLTATTDMAVLPSVLGCRPLRRTIQVRLGTVTLRLPRWHAHLRGLVTAIHETSGLAVAEVFSRNQGQCSTGFLAN